MQVPNALLTSNSQEWYTPKGITDLAKRAMNGIDLDPASNEFANNWIGAKKYYSIEEDGLSKPWQGKIWLNPPYGKECPKFVDKLLEEYDKGNVKQAVILVKPAIGTHWFKKLADRFIQCQVSYRIRFIAAEENNDRPAHGNVIFGLGINATRFCCHFSHLGTILYPL